jgi:hypothetical protein
MTQTFLATTRSTTQRLARVGLLGLAWLITSACGVQDELSEQDPELVQREAALYSWENVAAGKPVSAQGTVYNNLQLLTDSVFAPESTNWDNPQYAVITPAGSALQVDLGKSYTLSQLIVQADNNDSYAVEGSLDGASWTRLTDIAPYGSWGLTKRPAITLSPAVSTRFIRIYATGGDGSYSVSELQAFASVYYPDPTNCCCTGTCGKNTFCPDVQCPAVSAN